MLANCVNDVACEVLLHLLSTEEQLFEVNKFKFVIVDRYVIE